MNEILVILGTALQIYGSIGIIQNRQTPQPQTIAQPAIATPQPTPVATPSPIPTPVIQPAIAPTPQVTPQTNPPLAQPPDRPTPQTTAQPTPVATPQSNPRVLSEVDVQSPLSTQVFDRINTYRTTKGLPPLTRNQTGDKVAAEWSQEMSRTQKLSHDKFQSNINAVGGIGWENVAYVPVGNNAAEQIVTGWINSPGHEQNIRLYSVGELGTGIYCDTTYCWATQIGIPTGAK